ncbi:hypothetical protein BDV93DRAFT_514433 [Ceratobasidium sp. AG-I]|nr:hypothetical protein BDV93DRAFT_514433 [Ceratobasidium sp. AG-I]
MPRGRSSKVARARTLAANREKRHPNANQQATAILDTTQATDQSPEPTSPALATPSVTQDRHLQCEKESLSNSKPNSILAPPFEKISYPITCPSECEEVEFEDPESDLDEGSMSGDDLESIGEVLDVEGAVESEGDENDNQPYTEKDINEMLAALVKIIGDGIVGHGKDKHSIFDDLMLSRIRLMTMSLRLTRILGKGLIAGSEMAASAVGRGRWAARTAREWIRHFHRTGGLPANIYGRWNESVIEDEDLADAIREHLRCIGNSTVDALYGLQMEDRTLGSIC